MIVDGTISFVGGANPSISPLLLNNSEYHWAENLAIGSNGVDVHTRFGFRAMKLEFRGSNEETIYRDGKLQAVGNFTDSLGVVLVRVVSGYVFLFRRVGNVLRGRLVNRVCRNDPHINRAYIITIPRGCIINDGVSAPLICYWGNIRRARPRKNELVAGLNGVYLQCRLFYLTQDRSVILASDFKNPTSLQEAKDSNIVGFSAPEDISHIIALGRRNVTSKNAEGGKLVFSTESHTYSVDVTGARSEWGTAVGRVTSALTGLGASSPDSYATANQNVYFRTAMEGLSSFTHAYTDINKADAIVSEYAPLRDTHKRDTDHLLKFTLTQKWGDRLLTTHHPQIADNGCIYFKVLSSSILANIYAKLQPTLESFWSGLRFTGIDPTSEGTCYLDSYDTDKANRIYLVDTRQSYDTTENGTVRRIQSALVTKEFDFGQALTEKRVLQQRLSMPEVKISADLTMWASSKSGKEMVEGGSITVKNDPDTPIGRRSDGRQDIVMPAFTKLQGRRIQYMLRMEGWCSIRDLNLFAEETPAKLKLSDDNPPRDPRQIYEFTYLIHRYG